MIALIDSSPYPLPLSVHLQPFDHFIHTFHVHGYDQQAVAVH